MVIASREDLGEAKALAGEYKGSRIFKSDNGWYAVVIGPFPARTMDDFQNVYDGPSLPDDTYLARGKNFVSQEWPVQADGSVAEAEASDDVKMVQFQLAIDDYDVDEFDGQLGSKTVQAIRQYQSDWELTQTGEISPDLVSRLKGEHDATKSRWQKVENLDCEVWNENPQAREKVSWSGDCTDGKASGKGILVWEYIGQGGTRMSTYDGEYRAGRMNGRGAYFDADGDRYDGEWLDGDEHGQGVWTWADGDRYEGGFKGGEYDGRGVRTWAGGGRYEGEWSEGAFSGNGVRTWADGDRYDGEWSEGKKQGQGVYAYSGGDQYDGEWREGKKTGAGRLYLGQR